VKTRGPWAPLAIAAAVAALLTVAGDASACPVCYGDSDSAAIEGAQASVAFLGVLLYGLLGSGAAMFVALRRKVRDNLRTTHGNDP
jgi:hypothetical protein